ncbi:uncharacterized protein LOC127279647 [Leptopilina boulardi]|uniref:uncharacterized protein LOC127279647 n=1 Tax=Leptopilina boulardi TaxID=63433 RepID=UPI0021F5A4B0|nr:uncharacterized protein LOC127279647 [Leptopilina boulardi]
MPIFKVSDSTKSVQKFIRGLTIVDVLQESQKKLDLPDGNYKVISELEGIEIEDDDILLELSQMSKQPLSLLVIPLNESNNNNGTYFKETSIPVIDLQFIGDFSNLENVHGKDKSDKQTIVLGDEIMNLCPPGLINSINNKQAVHPLDRRKLVANISEYMIHVIKDTSRGLAIKIVSYIIDRSSGVFIDKIGDVVLGSGVITLVKLRL